MFVATSHLHLSEVCSKVSCWAILLSILIPPSQVLASQHAPHLSLHQSKHSSHLNLNPAPLCYLTIYLETTFDPYTLPMQSFISSFPVNTHTKRSSVSRPNGFNKSLVNQPGKHLAPIMKHDALISRRSSAHSLQNLDQSINAKINKPQWSNPKLNHNNNRPSLQSERKRLIIGSPSLQLENNYLTRLSIKEKKGIIDNSCKYQTKTIVIPGIMKKDSSHHHEQGTDNNPTPRYIHSKPIYHGPFQPLTKGHIIQNIIRRINTFKFMELVHGATILARDDSIAGRLVMILMSTICGIGVGMFGALLFVVALKVRILQSKRRGQQQQRQRQQAAGSFSHQITTIQQYHETKCKRVIPRGILDGFEIQTVNPEQSSTERLECPRKTTSKSNFNKCSTGCRKGSDGILSSEGLYNQDVPDARISEEGESDDFYEWDSSNEDEEGERYFGNITTAITSVTMSGSYRRMSHSRRRSSVQYSSQEKFVPFVNVNAQTMCSICLSDYEIGEQVRTLPCYHKYHVSCIDPWLLQVTSLCPICKQDLLPLTGTTTL